MRRVFECLDCLLFFCLQCATLCPASLREIWRQQQDIEVNLFVCVFIYYLCAVCLSVCFVFHFCLRCPAVCLLSLRKSNMVLLFVFVFILFLF